MSTIVQLGCCQRNEFTALFLSRMFANLSRKHRMHTSRHKGRFRERRKWLMGIGRHPTHNPWGCCATNIHMYASFIQLISHCIISYGHLYEGVWFAGVEHQWFQTAGVTAPSLMGSLHNISRNSLICFQPTLILVIFPRWRTLPPCVLWR